MVTSRWLGSVCFLGIGLLSMAAIPRSAPSCDLMLRMTGSGLAWQCVTGDCEQCGVQGSCVTANVTQNDGGAVIYRCKCEDMLGNRAGDTCSLQVTVYEGSVMTHCLNGPESCECHPHDQFYMGWPGCNPSVPLPVPEDFAAVCNCGGHETKDNHP
jgi:hypothetical protein